MELCLAYTTDPPARTMVGASLAHEPKECAWQRGEPISRADNRQKSAACRPFCRRRSHERPSEEHRSWIHLGGVTPVTGLVRAQPVICHTATGLITFRTVLKAWLWHLSATGYRHLHEDQIGSQDKTWLRAQHRHARRGPGARLASTWGRLGIHAVSLQLDVLAGSGSPSSASEATSRLWGGGGGGRGGGGGGGGSRSEAFPRSSSSLLSLLSFGASSPPSSERLCLCLRRRRRSWPSSSAWRDFRFLPSLSLPEDLPASFPSSSSEESLGAPSSALSERDLFRSEWASSLRAFRRLASSSSCRDFLLSPSLSSSCLERRRSRSLSLSSVRERRTSRLS
mmetsp:Transcript_30362/g.66588  ORF Transcript_30362/g.66588 Transcript_30362/m.66588 type:complete len:339 (+) Transcript_30362:396-1412(+)